ncbi:CRISPR-associated protein, Csd1 family [Carboxydocella sporoproducens DSM 16521]|uniref:CRISPR-associated protein, Csd1 family n=2 Tax=Carboxydocella TaxID=178898 RepID=A0A1T4SJ95_9FIRM|nr:MULTISPECIES: type I-C CRISPR-associated protein Cas8c/Csd1 [Carboxydocella]AVX19276.1 CRISPR-associated protein, Csd1 family [Carboxydocella thermautotrophica]SKA27911.1 CRISPR-associated protein, Csd1 family [Carboxydocella sporoproducens DSM 16521]
MIINSLYQYYERLLEDPDSGVSRPGFNKVKVSFALIISNTGELLDIVDLREIKGKKLVLRELDVPEQIKRASGISANFMCDNCMYVLGIKRKKNDKKERIRDAFEAFTALHEKILGEVDDEGAIAILRFLRQWDIDNADKHPKIVEVIDDISEGGNLVFRLEGAQGYIHERKAIIEAWHSYRSRQSSEVISQCLVTGKKSSIARLHPNIKGVTGAQSSGASLVSFNLDAFTSYGKSQSYNAPVSENVAFGYTTALNYLLTNEKHRVRIGDTTTVFWAERSGGLEEDLLGALFFPANNTKKKEGDDQNIITIDPKTVKLLHDIFSRIRAGEPVNIGLDGIDPQVNFYILGLAPNASRLSVRFWHVDQYGKFIEKIAQHYIDLAIVKSFENEPDYISIDMILKETAPLGDYKKIPPLLGGALIRSILTGIPYPQTLYHLIISRIRADQKVNYTRAAIIKACLVRNQRYYKRGNEVKISMALEEQNTNVAYRLGRLFALLEKVQEDANPDLNSTIKDRYFGAASATPGSIFPILLRLAQHHIAKAKYGRLMDERIEEVINSITNFPAYLNLEEQGLFVLGYYHQRKALFTKNEKKEG